MLDQQKDIDAVIVATPDHTHAVVALAAIERGKHVYVQKPLAHSVYEARVLTEAARKHKVATQMGNQGHSGDGARLTCEWIWSGAIGAVREVHAWTNRPVWPQGVEVERPKETPPVPASLDWDLWIGPAAYRPYHPTYHPGTWRAWWDFGTGSLGDLGCHILDAPFWALKLKYPVSVEGCISTYWHGLVEKTEPKNEQYPALDHRPLQVSGAGRHAGGRADLVGRRDDAAAARANWKKAARWATATAASCSSATTATLMCGCYGSNPQLIPEAKMKDFKQPAPTIDRIPGGIEGHEQDWVRACKGGKPASSNFDYSGPLSETVLMGNLAVRYPNRRLLWDGEKMQVTNDAKADAYVRREYRQGWSL